MHTVLVFFVFFVFVFGRWQLHLAPPSVFPLFFFCVCVWEGGCMCGMHFVYGIKAVLDAVKEINTVPSMQQAEQMYQIRRAVRILSETKWNKYRSNDLVKKNILLHKVGAFGVSLPQPSSLHHTWSSPGQWQLINAFINRSQGSAWSASLAHLSWYNNRLLVTATSEVNCVIRGTRSSRLRCGVWRTTGQTWRRSGRWLAGSGAGVFLLSRSIIVYTSCPGLRLCHLTEEMWSV